MFQLLQEGRATVNQDTRLDNRVIDLRVRVGRRGLHPFLVFMPTSGLAYELALTFTPPDFIATAEDCSFVPICNIFLWSNLWVDHYWCAQPIGSFRQGNRWKQPRTHTGPPGLEWGHPWATLHLHGFVPFAHEAPGLFLTGRPLTEPDVYSGIPVLKLQR